MGRDQTILRIQRLQKDNEGNPLNFSKEKASNQKDPTSQMNKGYYDLSKGVFRKKIEELPNIYARFRFFAFEYKVHKNGILTPPKSFKAQNKCKKSIKQNEA